MPNLRKISQSAKGQNKPPEALPYGTSEIREYVGGMSIELAKMARADGDEKLACLLEVAADVARRRAIEVA
ncbi:MULTISPECIES: hypothetical protein [unclassified Brevundimonas]|uniref:hypothetical protein n=1 Tax=unclassified Brevundimonas TaxID=2622653 RepID=UPI0025BF1C88|nr:MULTISPECIES: hypothetical protein [unclassified Brevundimonas]